MTGHGASSGIDDVPDIAFDVPDFNVSLIGSIDSPFFRRDRYQQRIDAGCGNLTAIRDHLVRRYRGYLSLLGRSSSGKARDLYGREILYIVHEHWRLLKSVGDRYYPQKGGQYSLYLDFP